MGGWRVAILSAVVVVALAGDGLGQQQRRRPVGGDESEDDRPKLPVFAYVVGIGGSGLALWSVLRATGRGWTEEKDE